jgi:hypothetical protein
VVSSDFERTRGFIKTKSTRQKLVKMEDSLTVAGAVFLKQRRPEAKRGSQKPGLKPCENKL